MNGKLWTGENNSAGEFSHMKIAGEWIGNAPKCGLGEKYCWESIASGRAWYKLAKKYGDKKADEIVIHNVVTGLLNLTYILNPNTFILGGGLMEHKGLIKKIRAEFNKQAVWPWFKKVRIITAKMEDDAILLGSLI